MLLDDALRLFNRLGVQVAELTRAEFKTAYYTLAWKYHGDQTSHAQELMANINAARSTILKSYRWRAVSEEAPGTENGSAANRFAAGKRRRG
jgi:DnaJ-class molecular chaperone